MQGLYWYEISLLSCAFLFLLGSIDDALIDLLYFAFGKKTRAAEYSREEWNRILSMPEQPIALLIPAWQESAVLEAMVRTNLSRIRYKNFRWFIGVYPNDPETLSIAKKLEGLHSDKITVVVTDRPGPTSKAHCLNCVLSALEKSVEYSEKMGETPWVPRWLAIHDAEDVIDPLSLKLINAKGGELDFIQLPVFSMPVSKKKLVQASYMDEFAELHQKDLMIRKLLKLPIPSAGVGTYFSWQLVKRLKVCYDFCFDENNLTEDYEFSLRVARISGTQDFLYAENPDGAIIATRGYFPDRFWAAVRQKTRWTIGITLQTALKWTIVGMFKWPKERRIGLVWALMRDRRALWVNPTALLGYALIFTGLFVFSIWPSLWRPLQHGLLLNVLCAINMTFLVMRAMQRMRFTARLYGSAHGYVAFPRMFVSIAINGLAAVRAIRTFFGAPTQGKAKPIAWAKTDHEFPSIEEIENRQSK